jgi:hypothetical protein
MLAHLCLAVATACATIGLLALLAYGMSARLAAADRASFLP